METEQLNNVSNDKDQDVKGGEDNNKVGEKASPSLKELFHSINKTLFEYNELMNYIKQNDNEIFLSKYEEVNYAIKNDTNFNFEKEINLIAEKYNKESNENYDNEINTKDEVNALKYELSRVKLKQLQSKNDYNSLQNNFNNLKKEVELLQNLNEKKETFKNIQNTNKNLKTKKKIDLEHQLNKAKTDKVIKEDETDRWFHIFFALLKKDGSEYQRNLGKLENKILWKKIENINATYKLIKLK